MTDAACTTTLASWGQQSSCSAATVAQQNGLTQFGTVADSISRYLAKCEAADRLSTCGANSALASVNALCNGTDTSKCSGLFATMGAQIQLGGFCKLGQGCTANVNFPICSPFACGAQLQNFTTSGANLCTALGDPTAATGVGVLLSKCANHDGCYQNLLGLCTNASGTVAGSDATLVQARDLVIGLNCSGAKNDYLNGGVSAVCARMFPDPGPASSDASIASAGLLASAIAVAASLIA